VDGSGDGYLRTVCDYVHLLARAESSDGIACWLQTVQGGMAQFYNRRKGQIGAF
jgi:hypothetical protein